MNTFHHGGRIGDLIFALYTMKQLGGGNLVISDYHKPNWSLDVARSLDGLLKSQEYINHVWYTGHRFLIDYDVSHDLQHAEDDYNPSQFPEWDKKHWPGNCNIVKRYAVHFGVEYPPREPWLSVPDRALLHADVTMHIPDYRMVRKLFDWYIIYRDLIDRGVKVLILSDWYSALQSAELIKTSTLLLGCVSSCNAMAEAMGVPTWVEHADGCWNVKNHLQASISQNIDGWSNEKVVEGVCNTLKNST